MNWAYQAKIQIHNKFDDVYNIYMSEKHISQLQ
jgi:hypothetical protein